MKDFEALFQEYKGLVFKTAMLIINNLEDAEDILQDVFTSAWKARNTFDSTKGKFIVWLYRITVNKSISMCRKKWSSTLPFEETMYTPTGSNPRYSPERALEIKLEYEKFSKTVDILDSKHRVVLVLRYIDDLSYNDIADILDIPMGTVKSRIHNALKLLHKQMNAAVMDVDS